MSEVVIRLRGVRIDCAHSSRRLLRIHYGFIATAMREGYKLWVCLWKKPRDVIDETRQRADETQVSLSKAKFLTPGVCESSLPFGSSPGRCPTWRGRQAGLRGMYKHRGNTSSPAVSRRCSLAGLLKDAMSQVCLRKRTPALECT